MISWDGTGKNPHKAEGPLTAVNVPYDQIAVFVDMGSVLGSLHGGQHQINAATAPFLGRLSPSAELYFVRKGNQSARFGNGNGPRLVTGPMLGNLRHFGEWMYTVVNPEAFVRAALTGDPLQQAGSIIGGLFNGCAFEWISGGHMTVLDLAPNRDKFLQVLPAHIGPAIEPFGLQLVEIVDYSATVSET